MYSFIKQQKIFRHFWRNKFDSFAVHLLRQVRVWTLNPRNRRNIRVKMSRTFECWNSYFPFLYWRTWRAQFAFNCQFNRSLCIYRAVLVHGFWDPARVVLRRREKEKENTTIKCKQLTEITLNTRGDFVTLRTNFRCFYFTTSLMKSSVSRGGGGSSHFGFSILFLPTVSDSRLITTLTVTCD